MSSLPNLEETTTCSLTIRKTPIVKFTRRQTQHETSDEETKEARGWDCTFSKIRRLDHSRSRISERGKPVEMRTQKKLLSCRMISRTGISVLSSDEDKASIRNHVVFTKIYSSITEAGHNSHSQFRNHYLSSSRFTMDS